MRVLHFYKTYFPETMGGIEQVIYQIVHGTAAHGVSAEVLSLTTKKVSRTIQIENHLAHRARMDFQIASTGISISSFFQFAKLSRKVDLIHYHYPWPFMDIVHFATKLKKPTVVTYHSDIIRQKFLLKMYRPLKRKFLNSVDKIVATSPNYLASSPVLNKYRYKTSVIPIGINKQSYPEPSVEVLNYWRSRLGERFFLFVGVIRYYKGLHILLDAAQGTNFPIVIVGSGPVENELKEHARRLGLQNIYFAGVLPDEYKVALMRLCYAVVFPSHLRSEAFGVSLLEGAMYGKPMISSEIGTGTSYINAHAETGLVVPPSNPEAFRTAMQYLWDNPKIAAEMGRRAEIRYHRLFSADQMAKKYVDLYNELLGRTQ